MRLMIKLALSLVLILNSYDGFGQESIFDDLNGKWNGQGTLFGRAAVSEIEWNGMLDETFSRLVFLRQVDGFDQAFKAEAIYQIENDSTAVGWWFDSRSEFLKIKATLGSRQMISDWESNSDKGRTIYELTSDSTMHVRDLVWRNGEWADFSTTTFVREQ